MLNMLEIFQVLILLKQQLCANMRIILLSFFFEFFNIFYSIEYAQNHKRVSSKNYDCASI